MLRADVVVVGAGPAGASAAIALARAGREVVLVDKATFPRDKTCGDGLTTLALRLLGSLGLDPGTVPSWTVVDGAVVHGPDGRAVHFPLPPGPGIYAAVARRSELDRSLVDLAAGAGADLHEGRALRGLVESDDRVRVETDDGPIEARYLVAADGMWSPTRKALGLGVSGYRGDWHAFRSYLRPVAAAAEQLHVWFESELLPGYAWSFPLADGSVNVGFGVRRRPGEPVGPTGRRWNGLWAREPIREVLGTQPMPTARPQAWPIPARTGSVPLVGRRTLFAGDAAAVTDVLTGEGIGQALLTGVLAAEAISSTGPHGARVVTQRYREAVLDHLLADHRMSAALGSAIGTPLGARLALGLVGTNDWSRRHFARWLFEDEPRAVALTPRRWHRRLFRGPGAYAGPPFTPPDAGAPPSSAPAGGPAP